MSNIGRQWWTAEEDAAIVTLVEEHGDKKLWAVISKLMSERFGGLKKSGKQWRERWYNNLCPGISKREWTDLEEKLIFEAHAQYGNRWSKIAKKVEGRSENSIKNFFYSRLRKRLRHYNKNHPGEEQIIGSVTNLLKNRKYAKILLAPSKKASKLGLHSINDMSIGSASSLETIATKTPNLVTQSLPSMNILISPTTNMQRPTQIAMKQPSMKQSAMYQTQMPQNAFGYMQHGNNTQRTPSYKQMRPQGSLMIPPPIPIQSMNTQNMMDPTSNPPSGQMISPMSPFDFPSPDLFSPMTFLPNSYPY